MRTFWTLIVIALILTLVASTAEQVLIKLACVGTALILSVLALLVFLLVTRDPAPILSPRRRPF